MLTIIIGEVTLSGDRVERAEMSVERVGADEPLTVDFAFKISEERFEEYKDGDDGIYGNITLALEELEAATAFLRRRLEDGA